MSVPCGLPVAGRRLPDEEVTLSSVTQLSRLNAKLRQRTLFEYVPLVEGRKHERGLSKDKSDFELQPRHLVPWGDPVISGTQVDERGVFRLISHNVNGLSSADNHADAVHLAELMAEKLVGLFGLQETNRNFERLKMVDTFHRAVRSVSTHHHGVTTLAKLQWPCDYQPGGTAVSVRNHWATRYLDKGGDIFGRWSWMTMAGRGTTKITFILAYRVCDGASEAAITSRTVRAQQEWMYADRGLLSINLREQFVIDLITLIRDFQLRGHDIVLMMDVNEACRQGSAVDRLIYACHLSDVHAHSGHASPPATYHRGTEKIDFVLVLARIAPMVTAAAILGLHDGYLSDHRALLVDFDAHSLFMGNTSPVVASSARRLTSTNPIAVHTYMNAMLTKIERHGLAAKVFNLQQHSESGEWTEAHVCEWEKLDRFLEEARLSSERKCSAKKSGQAPWSPALKLAGQSILYWRMRLCELTGTQASVSTLAKLAKSIGLAEPLTTQQPYQVLRAKLQQARLDHSAAKKEATRLREEFLTERAKFLAATQGMSEHAACAAIVARERSSQQFRQ